MQVQPYLFFEGRCEEAIEFYKKVMGAQVEMLMRYKDSPEPPQAGCVPASPEMVMHASLKIGDTVLMLSDGLAKQPANFKGFSLSVSMPSVAESQRVFAALSDGGKVMMPLMKTFYSPSFGMLDDKFGVSWIVMATAAA